MNINLSVSGIVNSVWAAASRLLSSLGTGVCTMGQFQNQSLAANATVNFTAVANTSQDTQVGVLAGAAGQAQFFLFDGTRNYLVGSVTAGATGTARAMITGAANQLRLTNGDGTNAASYMFSTMRWIQ